MFVLLVVYMNICDVIYTIVVIFSILIIYVIYFIFQRVIDYILCIISDLT